MTADIIKLEDLDGLDKVQERPSSLKRIRDHHHFIARLIAQGKRTTEVAKEVGYSISRVSILKGDPAFRQLVEMYKANYNQIDQIEYADVKKKAALLLSHTLDHRIDQYEEDPDSLTASEVRADAELAQSVLDDKVQKVATLHGHLESTNIAEQFELQSRRADRLIAPAHLPGSVERPESGVMPTDPTPVLPQED
jgi:hypothetical protein